MEPSNAPELYFSDFFKVDPKTIEEFGAFNISLVSDLPLFIDPFLLFNSKKQEYKELHDGIINYLKFLRDKSKLESIDRGLLNSWFTFKEVSENWLGFTVMGNRGSALGQKFASALHQNLYKLFNNFGNEQVTKGSHLEKLCLIKEGVGRDNISDFTTNLIKDYLLKYTESFARQHLDVSLTKKFRVRKVRFNYDTESWEDDEYILPNLNNEFVILTPVDMLTKDDTWINKSDLFKDFDYIPDSIDNESLRSQVGNYFQKQLMAGSKGDKEPTSKERTSAAHATIQEFPALIDYYIKYKEENGETAKNISGEKVEDSKFVYVNNVRLLANALQQSTEFYNFLDKDSHKEAMLKIKILKDYIENKDGYRFFYDKKGNRIRRESDFQLLFGLLCHRSTPFDVNREPNNGRGAVDYKLSMGASEKTLVEFKLAGNKKLKQNLANQLEVYKKAEGTDKAIEVIMFFSTEEYERTVKVLNELELSGDKNIILIDARKDNKVSASNVK